MSNIEVRNAYKSEPQNIEYRISNVEGMNSIYFKIIVVVIRLDAIIPNFVYRSDY